MHTHSLQEITINILCGGKFVRVLACESLCALEYVVCAVVFVCMCV